eukprot:scaffold177580_cov36-Prasinocladus_malaysianus.AAC.1
MRPSWSLHIVLCCSRRELLRPQLCGVQPRGGRREVAGELQGRHGDPHRGEVRNDALEARGGVLGGHRQDAAGRRYLPLWASVAALAAIGWPQMKLQLYASSLWLTFSMAMKDEK